MNKTQLRQLIAGGRIETAIQALLDATDIEPRFQQDTLLLSARYQEYKRAQRNNLESPADLERRHNQITFALLEIVNSLPEDFVAPTPAEASGNEGGSVKFPPTSTGLGTAETGTGGPIYTGTGDGNPILTGTGDGRLPSNAPFWFSVAAFAVLLGITLFVPGWAQQNNALFKTLLALAAAGVAATLPGFLNFEVGNTVKAGGALAAFVLVFLVNPAKEEVPTTLAVQVRAVPPSAQYPPLKTMELEIWNKNEWLKGKFSEEGVADFKNLSPDIIGKTVALRWKAEHYRPAKDSLLVVPPSVVAEFVPDGSLGQVSGTVQDARGNFLSGAIVRVEGIADTTDIFGLFELSIPVARQKAKYRLIAMKTNYETWENLFSPTAGQEAPIVLTKSKK